MKPEEDSDVIGNKQEEFDKLMIALDNASPKR